MINRELQSLLTTLVMKFDSIFSVPIWSYDTDFDLEEICNFVYEKVQEKQLLNRYPTLVGGTQTEDYYEEDLSGTCIEPLYKLINKTLRYSSSFWSNEKIWVIDNMWFNLYPPGATNESHYHINSFMSGVFFVKSPQKSGSLIFERDKKEDYIIKSFLGQDCNSSYSCSTWEYESKENLLLIFPGWINHRVSKNLSSHDRISISFNTRLV